MKILKSLKTFLKSLKTLLNSLKSLKTLYTLKRRSMIESGNQKNRLSNFIFFSFFSDTHTKISLLINFYINLIIFRYFFSGSNMCHNTYKNVYMLFLQKAAIF